MAQRAVWTSMIVIIAPLVDLAPRVFVRQEFTDFQAVHHRLPEIGIESTTRALRMPFVHWIATERYG
jgi:hypothetical protein